MNINTLPSISLGLGLNRNTLAVVFARYDKRGKSRPQPVARYGPARGVAVYNVEEVEAWYVARSFEPRPVRGKDRGPRKSTKEATS